MYKKKYDDVYDTPIHRYTDDARMVFKHRQTAQRYHGNLPMIAQGSIGGNCRNDITEFFPQYLKSEE